MLNKTDNRGAIFSQTKVNESKSGRKSDERAEAEIKKLQSQYKDAAEMWLKVSKGRKCFIGF